MSFSIMVEKTSINDWRGKIIGFIETDSNTGNKVIKDFYGRILGRYNKKLDATQDFYGRIVAKGDQSSILFSLKDASK